MSSQLQHGPPKREKKKPELSDHQQYMAELQAQKVKYNRDLSTIVTSTATVPLKSLQAVVSKELGAEQAKLQKQVEYWQTQASQLQQQLDDAGDIQGQLQELRLMKEQRDATPELGALTEPGTAAEHVMMLKRQQQRIRDLSEEKLHLEENILALAERFRAFSLQANIGPPLPQDIEADIAKLREQYEKRQEAAVAYVKLACDEEREQWRQQRESMDADAEEKKKELKRLQDKVQLQNREMERMHKRIVELADSERMEARVATMRLELDRQASASAATIRKLHAQVLAQAKQYSVLEKLVGPSLPSSFAAPNANSSVAFSSSSPPTAHSPQTSSSLRLDVAGGGSLLPPKHSATPHNAATMSTSPSSVSPAAAGSRQSTLSPALALSQIRDGSGSVVRSRTLPASTKTGGADAADTSGQDAQLHKLRQALDKITTSPGGAADEVVLERGQQEWHERYSRAFDDLERMQSSLKRQQQNQQQHQQQYYLQQNRQDQEQQQLINEHSEHMLAAIQNKLAGDLARRQL